MLGLSVLGDKTARLSGELVTDSESDALMTSGAAQAWFGGGLMPGTWLLSWGPDPSALVGRGTVVAQPCITGSEEKKREEEGCSGQRARRRPRGGRSGGARGSCPRQPQEKRQDFKNGNESSFALGGGSCQSKLSVSSGSK